MARGLLETRGFFRRVTTGGEITCKINLGRLISNRLRKSNPKSQAKENQSTGLFKSKKQFHESDRKLRPTWDSAVRDPEVTSSLKLSPWVSSAS